MELTDSKRNVEAQIEVNRTKEEHYDVLASYLALNTSNRKTADVLLKRLREAQDEAG